MFSKRGNVKMRERGRESKIENEPNMQRNGHECAESMQRESPCSASMLWERTGRAAVRCERETQMLCANSRTHWQLYFVCFGTCATATARWKIHVRVPLGESKSERGRCARKKLLKKNNVFKRMRS